MTSSQDKIDRLTRFARAKKTIRNFEQLKWTPKDDRFLVSQKLPREQQDAHKWFQYLIELDPFNTIAFSLQKLRNGRWHIVIDLALFQDAYMVLMTLEGCPYCERMVGGMDDQGNFISRPHNRVGGEVKKFIDGLPKNEMQKFRHVQITRNPEDPAREMAREIDDEPRFPMLRAMTQDGKIYTPQLWQDEPSIARTSQGLASIFKQI
jgi:hypothetical protein